MNPCAHEPTEIKDTDADNRWMSIVSEFIGDKQFISLYYAPPPGLHLRFNELHFCPLIVAQSFFV